MHLGPGCQELVFAFQNHHEVIFRCLKKTVVTTWGNSRCWKNSLLLPSILAHPFAHTEFPSFELHSSLDPQRKLWKKNHPQVHYDTALILPRKMSTCPLKTNGWKMYVLIEIVPFLGGRVSFRGGYSQLTSFGKWWSPMVATILCSTWT